MSYDFLAAGAESWNFLCTLLIPPFTRIYRFARLSLNLDLALHLQILILDTDICRIDVQ